MPTYDYRCKDCGHRFDVVQDFTDNTLTDCPECAGQLRKVFGSVGISFKGSGFYKNDSRPGAKPSGGEPAKAESSVNGSANGGDGGGKEGGGDAKAPAKDKDKAKAKTPSADKTSSTSTT